MASQESSGSGGAGERGQLVLIHRIARIAREDLPLQQRLQRVVEALKSHLRCELVACAYIDAARRRFVCAALACDLPTELRIGYSRALGSGVVGEVAAHGSVVNVPDVAVYPNYVETLVGVRSELCAAVRHDGEVMAVLNCESLQTDAFAAASDLLVTVAEQVAGMMVAARLNAEQQRRVLLLGTTSEVSRLALEGGDLGDTLQRIAAFVAARFDVLNCSLLLIDADRQSLVLAAMAGASVFAARCGEDWPLDQGVVGRALRRGEAEFVPDVRADPDYVMGNPAVVAEFVLPIRFHGGLLGLLNLEAAQVGAFDEARREVLLALAEQMAGAIHLAMTNQRLRATNLLVEEKSHALEQANVRLQEANAQLEHLSHLDGLTGIANRRRFDAALQAEWQRALRHGHPLSLLVLDIDDFKAYNDGYGHLAGDEALQRVAGALAAALRRSGDLLARYGGEEFVVLLPETGADEASLCARRLHAAVAALDLPHAYSRGVHRLSVSIGVASGRPQATATPAALIDDADRALYAAKQQGRNRVVTWGG
ncbi:MAG: diguanylate cyclase [Lysobacterales bacterium]